MARGLATGKVRRKHCRHPLCVDMVALDQGQRLWPALSAETRFQDAFGDNCNFQNMPPADDDTWTWELANSHGWRRLPTFQPRSHSGAAGGALASRRPPFLGLRDRMRGPEEQREQSPVPTPALTSARVIQARGQPRLSVEDQIESGLALQATRARLQRLSPAA